jgi:hypothetical protein
MSWRNRLMSTKRYMVARGLTFTSWNESFSELND